MPQALWLTIAEAVELSGYHPEHLRELVRDGKIAGQKFGIVWQVSKASLLAYLKAAKRSEDRRRGPKVDGA
jgi:excisionase family DNA binding protein